MAEAKTVKVKILRSVGPYMAGEVVEVSEEVGKHLTQKSQVFDGEKLVDHVRAMYLAEAEKLEKAPIDPHKMTQAEADALGKKNIVATPKDPDFEARAAMIKKGDEEFAKKKGKKAKEEAPEGADEKK